MGKKNIRDSAKDATDGAYESGTGAMKMGSGLKKGIFGIGNFAFKTVTLPANPKVQRIIGVSAMATAVLYAANKAAPEDGIPTVVWSAIQDSVKFGVDATIEGAPDVKRAVINSYEDVKGLFNKTSDAVEDISEKISLSAQPGTTTYEFASATEAIREDKTIALAAGSIGLNTYEELEGQSLRLAA